MARARKHKENCVFKALQLNSRRCARKKFLLTMTFRATDLGGVLHNSVAKTKQSG